MSSLLEWIYAQFARRRKPGTRGISGKNPRRARLSVESLELRTVPTTTTRSDALAIVQGPAWSPGASRAFVAAVPPALIQESYFNTDAAYVTYVSYFHGTLRQWVAQADQLGITDNNDLLQYLGQRLEGYFNQTKKYLAAAYPGQTTLTYELLMDMNLAHGYYTYATTRGSDRTIYRTLHLKTGDCTEIADLIMILAQAEGVAARELGQVYNFLTPQGMFFANHVVVYSSGLWLDGETNTAYAVDPHKIQAVPPTARLQTLFDAGRVFGFYNWYLQLQVRQQQLAAGEDGGIIAFYYQYYFEGLGQGKTQLSYVYTQWAPT
jgi:hypothetical protein